MSDVGAPEPLLDFVIIGAQKSASTYLQTQLGQHPQIDMPTGESRHFEDPHYGQGALGALADEFTERRDGLRRGIKRPDYLARTVVAPRLAAVVPDVKLLVVLREPVARAVSAYFDYVRLGFAPLEDVDAAFEHILDGSMQVRYPRVADVLDYGLYGRHLSRYLDLFDADQLWWMLQEDLLAEPLPHLQDVFRFLGVDDSFRPSDLGRRSNSSVYSPLRLRLLRSRNRWLFDYAADLSRREPRRSSLAGLAWTATATAMDRLVLTHVETGPPRLADSTRRRLHDYYASDLTLLETVLGRQLDTWRQASG